MKISKKMLPPLRFPEFSDSWQIRTIDQVLSRHSVAVEVEPETLYTQMGIRSHGKGIFHKEPVTGLSLGEKKVFWVQQDCLILNIIFAWEQAVAKTSERESGLIASHRFPMYQPKERVASIDFFVRFFLRPQGKHLLGLASPGGAGRNRTLGQKEFEKLKVIIPSLPEQQKIAAFLTAVDERIGQLSQKKSLLEEYKKGVMQQLFTQVLRFKDDNGMDFPDWQEKRLGALCSTFKSGKGITSGDISEQGLYPVYGGNGLRGYTNVYTHDGEFLLIGRQGALCGNINRVSGKTFISEHAISVAGNKETNTEWLAQRLDYLNLNRLSESSAQPGLAVNKLERLKLITPSLPEQTKIANFLTALDRKIESVATQITETQNFKKGLLQQMFI